MTILTGSHPKRHAFGVQLHQCAWRLSNGDASQGIEQVAAPPEAQHDLHADEGRGDRK
jgi:hypothetical protein